MTFFVVLLFGFGGLLVISALEDTSLRDTFFQIVLSGALINANANQGANQ